MRYISTRGQAPILTFDDVLLAGLARDGGLYVPETWPKFDRPSLRGLRGRPFGEVAETIILPFITGSVVERDLTDILAKSYAAFRHPAIAPVKQLDSGLYLAELFHGPTLAFKDYALQLVGNLFDRVLTARGQKVTIIGATSGDTGSAAIEACRDRDAIEIFILHPKGRVSEVQRRQMTSVSSSNVHNIALEGTFDDCQDMVKALFADHGLRDRYNFSAVNSINWARIMAQIVYYFTTALAIGAPDRKISFAVPTGNFGNVYAGYAARKMGLPVEDLIVASNANDILTRFFESGAMTMTDVVPTLSPSMDIQVSSNFERLLFDVYGRNGTLLAKTMDRFRKTGSVNFGVQRHRRISRLFKGARFGDNATKDQIGRIYRRTGELVDPHTAVGLAAAEAIGGGAGRPAVIALATAHPSKFPAAVKDATGIHPALPARMADLFDRPERCAALPNRMERVRDFIAGTLDGNGG